MRTINSLLLVFLLSIGVTSCKKESINTSIVGKWQIQEVFNGYVNGGNFKWTAVPAPYQHIVAFEAGGRFYLNEPSGNVPNQCTGTYSLISDGEVEIQSTCSTTPYTWKVDIANKTLIVTHGVREGEIKEKFIKVD